MRSSFVILILIITLSLYGQTDSIEKGAIYKKVLSKELTSKECQKTYSLWKKAVERIKKYPELPLDQSGQVYYSFLYELKNITKEKLFNRTLEWLSINYGVIPSYLYSNLEDGKIILRNTIDLSSANTCNYSYIISIKNERLMIEFINVRFQIYHEGHYSGDTWVPEKTTNLDITQIYPIILKLPFEWDLYLNILKITDEHFNNEVVNLCKYIVNYDSYYKF